MSQITKNLIAGTLLFAILCPAFYFILAYVIMPNDNKKLGISSELKYSKIHQIRPITENPVMDFTDRFIRKTQIIPMSKDEAIKMPYYFYEPESASDALPLVVVLHGGPGKAYAAKYLSDENMQKEFQSYILVPMAPKGAVWSDHKTRILFSRREELHNLAKLTRKVIESNQIDPSRIYIIGCSLGGEGVFGAATYYGDLFAAGVSISGSWPVTRAKKMVKTPLYIMSGKNDQVIPAAETRAISNALKKLGADITYKEYDMGHNCPTQRYYTIDVWHWLFSKKLN